MEPHGGHQAAHRDKTESLVGNVSIPTGNVLVWGGVSVVPEVGGTTSMPTVRRPHSDELLIGGVSTRHAQDQ